MKGQRGGFGSACVLAGGLVLGLSAQAAEHGGHEHGGASATQEQGSHEHGGQAAPTEPSAQQIRDRIAAYVKEQAGADGTFAIKDTVTGTTRALTFVRVHDRVGKTGDYYYSCTDMQDAASGELLDLDFDVEAKGSQLNVVDARIHKVSGKARYTYDDNSHRVPVAE